MVTFWEERFETGPEGAAITTANTNLDSALVFEGAVVFTPSPVREGEFCAGPSGATDSELSKTVTSEDDWATACPFSAWANGTHTGEVTDAPSVVALYPGVGAGSSIAGFHLPHGGSLAAFLGTGESFGIPGTTGGTWYDLGMSILGTDIRLTCTDEAGTVLYDETFPIPAAKQGTSYRMTANVSLGIATTYIDHMRISNQPARTVAPPCRGYPRDDKKSNSPRGYPPSKSRQYGNRANGYL